MPGARSTTWAAAAIAVAVHTLPESQSLLIFDRAAIRSGELWRLFSGSWIHYSTGHLRNNVVALAACGLLLGRQSARRAGLLFMASGLVIGLGIFMLRPDVERFAGLSGIACGLAAWAAVSGIAREGRGALGSWLLLAFVLGKIAFEFATGASLVAAVAGAGGDPGLSLAAVPGAAHHPVLALSHALGAATGVAIGLTDARPTARGTCSRVRRARPGRGCTCDVGCR